MAARNGNPHGLTDQQVLFCREYAKSLHAGESYEKAGYRSKSRNSRDAAASVLLRNHKIRAYLGEISNLNEAAIVSAIVAIAFCEITEIMQFDGRELIVKQTNAWSDRAKLAVKKIKYKARKKSLRGKPTEADDIDDDEPIVVPGELIDFEVEIEMYDRLSALDKLMRKLKLYPRELQTIECVSHLASKGLLLPGQAEAILNGLNEFEERLRSVSGGEAVKVGGRGISDELAAQIRSRIMGIDAESSTAVSSEVSEQPIAGSD